CSCGVLFAREDAEFDLLREASLNRASGIISPPPSRLAASHPHRGAPMRQIGLAIIFTVCIALVSSAAVAQQGGKIPRIGVLFIYSPDDSGVLRPYIYRLREGLQERGYVEGQNIIIEWRWARGNQDRLPALADELVRLKVDVLVTETNPTVLAAQAATRTIPILITVASDPGALGFHTRFARHRCH